MLWLLYDGKVDIKTKWIKSMLYIKKKKTLKKFFPRLPSSVSTARKSSSTFFYTTLQFHKIVFEYLGVLTCLFLLQSPDFQGLVFLIASFQESKWDFWDSKEE